MQPIINTLDEGAAMLHELFLSYRRAGFTEDQAMQLILQIVACSAGNAVANGGGGDAAT